MSPYQAKNQCTFYNPLFKKDCSLFHALERCLMEGRMNWKEASLEVGRPTKNILKWFSREELSGQD